jgi:hypothetical protein
MAKSKGGGESHKISFGKRKKGKARKSYNKHDKKSRVYRGQGKA